VTRVASTWKIVLAKARSAIRADPRLWTPLPLPTRPPLRKRAVQSYLSLTKPMYSVIWGLN
jgi:hypothetical protein